MVLQVKVKSIGNLQEGDKRDGSGKWYARDVVFAVNDGSMYPDEFLIRLTKDFAQNCPLSVNSLYNADISFSIDNYNGRQFQSSWLRKIEEIVEPL